MGTFSVFATGYVLDATDSWAAIFATVAACYVVGAAFYLAWASAEQQLE